MELPRRKRVRLKGYDYSGNGAYFITVCVKDRHEMLGQISVGRDAPGAPSFMQLSEYGIIIQNEINEIPSHYEGVTIDKFVVMPNHIHMIVMINRDDGAPRASRDDSGAPRASRPTTALVPTVITSMKKKINKTIGFSIWQTSYHDHIIRDEQEYQKIWEYIDENPVKWENDCFH